MDQQQPIFVSGQELGEWRNAAILDARAYDVPVTEVDWLLLSVSDLDSLQLRLESFKTRSQVQLSIPLEVLTAGWKRRLQERLPIQYVVGKTPWRRFNLYVSPAVLIPRPETECLIDLVEQVVRKYPELGMGNWVDMGTGSGAIALGIADLLPQAQVFAVDYSNAALAIAHKNAVQYGFAAKIQFIQGSWWQPLPFLQGQVSGMVANPPYIPTQLVPDLQPEVVKHEPHLALDGGNDGLDDIRQLLREAPQYLIPGGVWMIEMMAGQAETVANLLAENGNYRDIQIHQDLAGIERFAIAFRKGSRESGGVD